MPSRPPLRSFSLVVVLFAFTLLPTLVHAQVTGVAWISGDAARWKAALDSGSGVPSLVETALSTDLKDALVAAGESASITVTVSGVVPRTTVPIIGADVSFSVTGAVSHTTADDVRTVFATSPLNQLHAVPGVTTGMTVRMIATLPAAATPLPTLSPLAISGPCLMWKIIFDGFTDDSQTALFLFPFEEDLQQTLDSTVSRYLIHVTAANPPVTAASFFIDYEVYQIDPSISQPSSAAAINTTLFECPFTGVETSLTTLKAGDLAAYEDLFPSSVHAHVAAVENPQGPGEVEDLVVIDTNGTNVVLFFSGSAAGWKAAEMDADNTKTLIETAANDQLKRSEFVNTLTVDRMERVPPNDDLHNNVGLKVYARVSQGMTALSSYAWDAEALASVTSSADYTPVLQLYSGPAEEAALVAVGLDEEFKYKLHKEAVGMIIMGAVIVGLMFITFIIVLAVVCCCYKDDDEVEYADMEEAMRRRGSSVGYALNPFTTNSAYNRLSNDDDDEDGVLDYTDSMQEIVKQSKPGGITQAPVVVVVKDNDNYSDPLAAPSTKISKVPLQSALKKKNDPSKSLPAAPSSGVNFTAREQ